MNEKLQLIVDRIWYLIFSALFVAEILVIGYHGSDILLKMQLWQIVVIAIATKHLAHTISYFGVSDWWRHPFVRTVVDSSGAGENLDARDGLIKGVGELICCHVCSGTHAASLLIGFYSLNQKLGWVLILVLCVASLSAFLGYVQEAFEWNARHAREQSGSLWLEKNGIHSFGWTKRPSKAKNDVTRLLEDLVTIRQKSV